MSEDKLRYFLKRVTAELHESRERVRELETVTGEPIAVVGMGCRYPGGVRTPDELWNLVATGTDAVGDFPADRGWDPGEAAAHGYETRGGFLPDAAEFDPGFFGISPREALAMDPQQRFVMEVAWETLEHAGLDPRALRGSHTGVFVGASASGYDWYAREHGHDEGHLVTGSAISVLSGRVSYTLGLNGPAVTVDTACSSSLAAVHLAARSLRTGECSLALAGGVMVMSTPVMFADFARQQGLASDGRCKPFSEDADGTGWGEGAGLVLLERLSDARRNGHRVLAVIRGSAMNQDGASNGLTAPSAPAQRRVIRAALADARLTASEVDAVEAHGTGTELGDPIEAGALLATYGQGRDEDRPLWLGSLKSNIGHAQQAAGVGGVMKMVLALRHGTLPRTLHAGEPTSHVDWASGNVRLLQEPVEWPAGERVRRAGVSAFGASGTNVHVILEEAPAPTAGEPAVNEEPTPDEERPAPVLPTAASAWVVSGRNATALAGQAGRLREHVLARPELPVGDVAWSLATTRSAFERRAVVLGGERGELAAGLAAVATGQPAAGVVTGSVASGGAGRTVFVFPGQGSQWVGMGRELAEVSPVFAARLAECAEALAPYVDWQLDDVLAGRHGFEAADVVQPALWAVMVSLAAVWEAAGVAPDAVVGHSQGEIAAAAVAGILSLDDAAKVVALRSKTLTALAGRGGMLSIAEPVEGVRARIALYGTRLSVAAVNGPSATVVSGDADALRELADSCGESPRARMIPVDYASHSAHVDELREEILAVLQGIAPREVQVPMISALTGEWLSGPELDPAYWYASLRETVEFDRAVRILGEAGHGVFLEVSPHPVLTPAIADSLEDRSPTVVGTLRRDEGGAERLLTSLAEAYTGGAPVDWAAVLGGGTAVELPTYAFQRQRYWPAAPARPAGAAGVDDWRYRIRWQPADADPAAVPALSGTWLLVGEGDVADACARTLADHGAQVVRTGVETLDQAVTGPVSGVVSLLALEEGHDPAYPWIPRGTAATVDLVQALRRTGVDAPLWLLTRGAVQTGPDEVTTAPVQTQLWGMGRVIGMELPDSWGGLVDLPPEFDARTGARLVAVLADRTEDQVALRPSGTLARRLVRAEPRPAGRAPWRARGTVLLTGGTGSIGACVARWLAERDTPRVVLTSRSGPSAEGAVELAAAMATAGTAVDIVSCDTGVRRDVTDLVARIEATGPGLSTVLHSANTGYLARVEDTTREGLAAALSAKAAGATYLDEATAALDVDEFVLFSSISATWGSNDHGPYAAGNAFLDGLAEDRRARGLPGTSIAWGVWDSRDWDAVDDLMDHSPGRVTPRRLRRQGMNFLETERALTALDQTLADDETFIALADVTWEKFAPVFRAARPRPLLDAIPEAREQEDRGPDAAGSDRPAEATGELFHALVGLTAAERRRAVVELVRAHAAAVLGHGSAAEVPTTRAFRELGFDSLTAVELRNRLGGAAGVRLPATVVFDHPNPAVLAEEILSRLFGAEAAAGAGPVPAVVAAPAEPVAIVGMACRYPGGIRTPEELWALLAEHGDAIGGFPTDRGWNTEGLFDPDPDAEGKTYVAEGGFLTGAAEFDAAFFGISPREALSMDPQQRLLLETSWEAVERAGIDPKSLHGSATGVFVGAARSTYLGVVEETAGSEGHRMTGTAMSVLSGRIAYALGLVGPAMTVDTACSSSLVALHQAVQSLRSGECSVALAGGVTVMADPGEFVGFSRLRALSPNGRCQAFGEGADGMGMGEGVGIVVLERLSDARRNGHRVLGVVRGSAINQDGASNGLTAPNGPSQQRVIRAALANARISAADVDAVEAHGTGTELGDPIEAGALLATYGQERFEDRPLWLGSVKSNIGHAQQAAGVAGVIKMVLALQAGVLPKTLHADEPSSHVDWETGNVRLLRDEVAWPAGERPRRAGVSAFGISGTNAHVIIEEAPVEAETVPEDAAEDLAPVLSRPLPAWVLSGRDGQTLAGQAGRLREHVAERPELPIGDVAWSLATTRSAFEQRAVVLGTDREELEAGLSAVATGQPAPGVVTGEVAPDGVGRTVFVFPGQGSQWVGMGRELAESSPVFAARLAECAAALAPYVDWQLDDVLAGLHGFEAADVVQPALWAVMVSLAAVWEAAGVAPDAVVGHSQGEIAAAAVAGILSLDDAAKVVALRSKTLKALAGRGGMLSIAEPVDGVRARIAPYGSRLSVAAVNGPSATVVSGDADALRELADSCGEFPRARMIPVDYASHSAHVDELREEILAVLQGITPTEARIPMVSAMTGAWLSGPELDPAYWYASLRETVEFDRAVRILADAGHGAYVEVSPHPVLTPAISDAFADRTPAVVGTLRREDGGAGRLLASLAEAYVRGVPVDWAALLGGGTVVDLPTYAFRRDRFWPEPTEAPTVPVTAGTPAEAGFWNAVERGDADALADLLGVDPADPALGALTGWRHRERAESAVAGWRYRIAWSALPEHGTALTGTWLLVGSAPDVADTLTAAGARVLTVPGDGIDTTDREALAAALPTGVADLSGIVSALALDDEAAAPLDAHPGVPRGLAATLALAQAVADRRGDGDDTPAAPLWVLTRGAAAATDGEPAGPPVHAQIWALGRTAALAHPDLWGGLIDLPQRPEDTGPALRRLAAVLTGGDGEDQVALRPSGAYGRRLVRAAQPQAPANGTAWTPRGTVLVTGGTGAIGEHVARWLADRGTRRVVLTGRRGPATEGVAARAAELAARGTGVDVVACDVAERAEVAALLARIDATGGPALSTVLHTAGVGQGGTVGETTAAGLAEVCAPKAGGARWLDELTADRGLDDFVLFSSGAAVWGGSDQAGYAAANGYLDGLAAERRAAGRPATTLSWGLWDGGGMGGGSVTTRLTRYGVRAMAPELAVRALGQALDGGEDAVTVADIDWSVFGPTFTLRRPSRLLADLPDAGTRPEPADSGPGTGSDGPAGTGLADRLAGLPHAEQLRRLVEIVCDQAAAVLGHTAGALPKGRPFRHLGFDSVMAVDLRNRITDTTGRRLPATLVFDHPTPAELAEYLHGELGLRAAPADDTRAAPGTDPVLDGLDRLEAALAAVPGGSGARRDVTLRLRNVLSRWLGDTEQPRQDEQEQQTLAGRLDDADAGEVLDFINKELGLS
ncbi:type I polyketide synthase [Kitasatospora sp. NPDC001261]|uniref:type I polyketide synthase n=1 Tax=Kitasatospora sp. NPDC001261 TaxID=3364012 RepID=UPI0036AB8D4A